MLPSEESEEVSESEEASEGELPIVIVEAEGEDEGAAEGEVGESETRLVLPSRPSLSEGSEPNSRSSFVASAKSLALVPPLSA